MVDRTEQQEARDLEAAHGGGAAAAEDGRRPAHDADGQGGRRRDDEAKLADAGCGEPGQGRRTDGAECRRRPTWNGCNAKRMEAAMDGDDMAMTGRRMAAYIRLRWCETSDDAEAVQAKAEAANAAATEDRIPGDDGYRHGLPRARPEAAAIPEAAEELPCTSDGLLRRRTRPAQTGHRRRRAAYQSGSWQGQSASAAVADENHPVRLPTWTGARRWMTGVRMLDMPTGDRRLTVGRRSNERRRLPDDLGGSSWRHTEHRRDADVDATHRTVRCLTAS